MTPHTEGQDKESSTTSPAKRSKRRVIQDLGKHFWRRVAGYLYKKKRINSTPGYRPTVGAKTPGKVTTQHPKRSNDVEGRSPTAHRSNTAPASFGYALPIASARGMPTGMPKNKITDPESYERVDSLGSEAEPWVKTIHIHLDKDRPDLTELCRCLLDTGSDFNLVSQKTLRTLQLPFTEREGPAVTGLGGAKILPIGSVLLTWHMDRRERVTYTKNFWVISDETPALFDVLVGKHWIKEHKALLRNPKVMLTRYLGLDSSPSRTCGGGAQASIEGSR